MTYHFAKASKKDSSWKVRHFDLWSRS